VTPEKNARTTDPRSSHEAAARVAEFSAAINRRIIATLKAHGPLAAEQIADTIGDLDMVQVGRRTSDLKRDGLIEVHEPLGHTNRSGRKADILAAVPA
jgi:predicted ArsR family transcriptional regulator